HPHPDRILSTKALEITPDPGGHVILKAVQFLVEIGSSGHARSKGMHSICSGGEGRKRHTALTAIPITANNNERARSSGHGGGKRRSVTAVLSYSDAPRRDMLERGEERRHASCFHAQFRLHHAWYFDRMYACGRFTVDMAARLIETGASRWSDRR